MVRGGADREGTLQNILKAIDENNQITVDDVVLFHDAVRPFVSSRIIDDVINEMSNCEACNTVVPVNDTIVQCSGGDIITGIPNRSELFAGQSPQGFKLKTLMNAFENLDSETRKLLTETTKVCFVQEIPVHIVKGEFYNYKITTDYDFQVAKFLYDYLKEK